MKDLEHLRELLRSAAAHLRERGDFPFLNDEPDIFTSFELATLIEQLSAQLSSGDKIVYERLWSIFAITCAWDDAGGDLQIGQAIFETVDAVIRPTETQRKT